MERNFKRISDELKLPQESRERIRSQLASYKKQSEDVTMKKSTLKSRVPLIAVAVVMMMALMLTAAAAGVVHLFRNDVIVSSVDDIPAPSSENGAPGAVVFCGPSGTPPSTMDEMIESARYKSDDWTFGERINGGIPPYHQWEFVEVLSSDPTLRSRRVWRTDGAEKMEYTAENPKNLLDTLTDRAAIDLTWLNGHYNYVPDANMSNVITDAKGNYVAESLIALYAKPDNSGYVQVEFDNVAQADYYAQSYIIDGSYETAYYYTTPDGFEFLITMHNGRVWADCNTSHTYISLYGAYLSSDEVEDILDNLSLSIEAQP